MSAAVCRLIRCRCVLQFRTIDGRLVEFCAWCDRRRRGLCRDCPARVYGAIGKAVRCEHHARVARLESDKKHRRDPEVKRHINARDRRRRREDPEYLERRRRNAAGYRARNKEKVRRAKRRFLMKEGPTRERYLATQRKHNRNPVRAKKKRAAAVAKYYELHPVRPDPKCTGCGVAIAWTPGKGRPRLTCDSCCSPAELVRRQRGYNSAAWREQRAERVA